MCELLSQQISLELLTEKELHQKLIDTIDHSIGLDDASMRREGYQITTGVSLTILVGDDGKYGSKVKLSPELDDENQNPDDSLSINLHENNTIEVEIRSEEKGYLIRVNDHNQITAGFQTDKNDGFRPTNESGKLSSEHAGTVLEEVISGFEHEFARRQAVLYPFKD